MLKIVKNVDYNITARRNWIKFFILSLVISIITLWLKPNVN